MAFATTLQPYLLPVMAAIPHYVAAAQYVQNTDQFEFRIEFLVKIGLVVLGLLTLKGQISPVIGASCLVASLASLLVVRLLTAFIHHLRKEKYEACKRVLEGQHTAVGARNPHFYLKDRAAWEGVKKAEAVAAAAEEAAEADSSLDTPPSRFSLNATEMTRAIIPAITFISIITIAILALNSSLSPHQLKITVGSALVGVGILHIMRIYLAARQDSDLKGTQFILDHYREGDPVVEAALTAERSASSLLIV